MSTEASAPPLVCICVPDEGGVGGSPPPLLPLLIPVWPGGNNTLSSLTVLLFQGTQNSVGSFILYNSDTRLRISKVHGHGCNFFFFGVFILLLQTRVISTWISTIFVCGDWRVFSLVTLRVVLKDSRFRSKLTWHPCFLAKHWVITMNIETELEPPQLATVQDPAWTRSSSLGAEGRLDAAPPAGVPNQPRETMAPSGAPPLFGLVCFSLF